MTVDERKRYEAGLVRIKRLELLLNRKNLALTHLANITQGPPSVFASREAAATQEDASKDTGATS